MYSGFCFLHFMGRKPFSDRCKGRSPVPKNAMTFKRVGDTAVCFEVKVFGWSKTLKIHVVVFSQC